MDPELVQELIKRLNADREAYLENVNRTHQLLIAAVSNNSSAIANAYAPSAPVPRLTSETLLKNSARSVEIESYHKGSLYTGDETSDFDDAESWHVQEPLRAESYDEDGFKRHLLEYNWTESGYAILQDVGDKNKLPALFARSPTIFPTALDTSDDRSHHTHYSIFNVGSDGSPLEILEPVGQPRSSRSLGVWNRIKSTNNDSAKTQKAMGRITVVREPSPLLFAALHYTHHKHFDMDELFAFLVDDDPHLARAPNAFADDDRHQRSFAFTFEYFTIIDNEDGCEPMAWQRADLSDDIARTHIPISRCSSVVALSLEGKPMGYVKNKERRAVKRVGNVYDPFSPWRVLCIQAYPDVRSSLDVHDSTKHLVNGPEAFLTTLCGEFKDAAKRLTAVYKAITSIVEPPPDFIFSLATRDKLLFEDSSFTWSRRYFWAYNTLSIMNEDIEDMVQAYEETFKNSVWDGTDKIIWPGTSDELASSKHTNWRRKMKKVREDIEIQIDNLRGIRQLNLNRMKMVKGLHNNLFNGTSVLESRKSVENAMITVQQGRNIRLLTLVTIFFLPLTFVTSVFGMTNMPTADAPAGDMIHFAWATIAICIPTYLLIGSLNTNAGMSWWTRQVRRTLGVLRKLAQSIARVFAVFGYRPKWSDDTLRNPEEVDDHEPSWARPKAGKRLRSDMHLISRDTFNGMPMLSPADSMIAEKAEQEIADSRSRNVDSPTNAGEREKPLVQDFGSPWQPRLSNNLSGNGVRPPHRASIGIVLPSGHEQSSVSPKPHLDSFAEKRRKRRSTLSTVSTTPDPKEAADAVSETSERSEGRRSGVLRRMFQGRRRKSDDDSRFP